MAINFPSALDVVLKKEAVGIENHGVLPGIAQKSCGLPKNCATGDEKLGSNNDVLKNCADWLDAVAANTAAMWLHKK